MSLILAALLGAGMAVDELVRSLGSGSVGRAVAWFFAADAMLSAAIFAAWIEGARR